MNEQGPKPSKFNPPQRHESREGGPSQSDWVVQLSDIITRDLLPHQARSPLEQPAAGEPVALSEVERLLIEHVSDWSREIRQKIELRESLSPSDFPIARESISDDLEWLGYRVMGLVEALLLIRFGQIPPGTLPRTPLTDFIEEIKADPEGRSPPIARRKRPRRSP